MGLLALGALLTGAHAARGAPSSSYTEQKVVYLTFDDGPSPSATPKILALLARYRAQATFFALGAQLAAQPALARRIVGEGHLLANHTWSHSDLTRLPADRLVSEIERTERLIRAHGAGTRLIRPPYGAYDTATRRMVARLGYRLVLWDVDPQDWRRPGADVITANVLARTRSRSIVLLHDGGGDRSQTVTALARILATLTARGYAFRALAGEL